MKKIFSGAMCAAAAAALGGILLLGGCNSGHPDSLSAVQTALAQNKLSTIQVAEDRDQGVITLSGTVPTDDQRLQAGSIAMEAAATYRVQNNITVVPQQ